MSAIAFSTGTAPSFTACSLQKLHLISAPPCFMIALQTSPDSPLGGEVIVSINMPQNFVVAIAGYIIQQVK